MTHLWYAVIVTETTIYTCAVNMHTHKHSRRDRQEEMGRQRPRVDSLSPFDREMSLQRLCAHPSMGMLFLGARAQGQL